MTNPILLFLVEFFKRYVQKTPLFFKILGYITGAMAIITGAPEFLEWLGFEAPEILKALANPVLAKIMAAITAFIPLISETPVVAVVPKTGQVLKAINKEALPFTAAQEEKKELKVGGVLNQATDTTQVIVDKKIK